MTTIHGCRLAQIFNGRRLLQRMVAKNTAFGHVKYSIWPRDIPSLDKNRHIIKEV